MRLLWCCTKCTVMCCLHISNRKADMIGFELELFQNIYYLFLKAFLEKLPIFQFTLIAVIKEKGSKNFWFYSQEK